MKTFAQIQEEVLSELSKNTLNSYVNKAHKSKSAADMMSASAGLRAIAHREKGDSEKADEFDKKTDKHLKTYNKRETGVKRASWKIRNEETLSELSKETLTSYRDKARKDNLEHSRKYIKDMHHIYVGEKRKPTPGEDASLRKTAHAMHKRTLGKVLARKKINQK